MSVVGLAALVLFGVFFLLLVLGTPISIAIAVSSILTALCFLPFDQSTFIVMQKMNNGLDSFTLLAVPLFILAGNIMNNGGIARRLIRLAQLVAGRIPGSLAHTNVLANMLFGALSGSAVAAAAAIGGTMNKMEEEEGYDPAFAASVNIASAPTGLLIPPTTAFIVYSMIAGGVSISALFMAGVVPGVLMGLTTMAVAFWHAKRHGYPVADRVDRSRMWRIVLEAIPALLLVVVVIGGIVAGVFTATEGAGVAVLYTLVLSLLYRSLSWRALRTIMVDTVSTSGIVLFLIAASSAMSWVMAYTGIPGAISDALLSVSGNPLVIFLLMNLVLLVVGTFMDITPAILIFTPIFLPIVTGLGMDPVHFGVVLVFNMCIGTMTPPVGSVLFVGAGIAGVTIERIFPKLWPYLLALVVLLLVVTYLPALSLWLPGVMGLSG
ncbi:TRAP transporter large permease [Mobilicoccus massiliensis]|uniref:TRAP transporter large permease n=1 Tax=Mobilicoccus massiliensis TaxID=1522310 RepID=UPI00058E023B|nr:TRAP transporter large permease [Mobilicoccus massiliensis]